MLLFLLHAESFGITLMNIYSLLNRLIDQQSAYPQQDRQNDNRLQDFVPEEQASFKSI